MEYGMELMRQGKEIGLGRISFELSFFCFFRCGFFFFVFHCEGVVGGFTLWVTCYLRFYYGLV
jgi:hypothetical protein